MDAAQEIVFAGADESNPEMQIEYVPHGETEAIIVEMSPKKGIRREFPDIPFLGIAPKMAQKVDICPMLRGQRCHPALSGNLPK